MAFKDLSEKNIEEIKNLLAAKTPQATIAEQYGINQSDVSRIKNNKEYSKYPHMYISGISRKTREILENIAENKDLSFPQFMKVELHKIIDSTPDRFKRKPLD